MAVTAACVMVFGISLLQNSRILLVLGPHIATLGIAVIAACLLVALLLLAEGVDNPVPFLYAPCVLLFAILLHLRFQMNTGIANDIRGVAVVSATFLYFPVLYACRRLGAERAVRVFLFVIAGYVAAYLALSIAVIFFGIFTDVARRSLILNDPFRGARVFFAASAGAFLFFCAFGLRREGGRSAEERAWRTRGSDRIADEAIARPETRRGAQALAWTGTLLAVAAFILAQSRVVSAIMLLLLACWVVGAHRLLRWGMICVPVLLFVIGACAPLLSFLVQDELAGYDLPTLSLRIATMTTAAELFLQYPLFGFGYSSFSTMRMAIGHDYYFDDLGILGFVSIGGLFGLAWAVAAAAIMARIASGFLMSPAPAIRSLGYAAAFVLLTMFPSPTMMLGEGLPIFSLLWALRTGLQEEGRLA